MPQMDPLHTIPLNGKGNRKLENLAALVVEYAGSRRSYVDDRGLASFQRCPCHAKTWRGQLRSEARGDEAATLHLSLATPRKQSMQDFQKVLYPYHQV